MVTAMKRPMEIPSNVSLVLRFMPDFLRVDFSKR